jgi:hypothetical protein
MPLFKLVKSYQVHAREKCSSGYVTDITAAGRWLQKNMWLRAALKDSGRRPQPGLREGT